MLIRWWNEFDPGEKQILGTLLIGVAIVYAGAVWGIAVLFHEVS